MSFGSSSFPTLYCLFFNFLMSVLLEDTCALVLAFNSTKDSTNCLKLAIILALFVYKLFFHCIII